MNAAHERFKVMSAAEFMCEPATKASLERERAQRGARLAEQQRQIDAWQARRSEMTEAEILLDEIALLSEMREHTSNGAEAIFNALCESESTEFDWMENHEQHFKA